MSTTFNWSTMTNRERDACIAEHVFGRQVHAGLERGSETKTDYYFTDPVDGRQRAVACYSTDLRVAWHIADRFDVIDLLRIEMSHCRVQLSKGNISAQGLAETPAEAICIAALKAVGCTITD